MDLAGAASLWLLATLAHTAAGYYTSVKNASCGGLLRRQCGCRRGQRPRGRRCQSFCLGSNASLVPVPDAAGLAATAAADLCDLWAFNQRSRNAVKQWIIPETLARSISYYGLLEGGQRVNRRLSRDTGDLPLQHDLITQIGTRLQAKGQRVRYLEIGVSVLKCIHTQVSAFRGASITALDIEDPNVLIESGWGGRSSIASWTASKLRRQHGRPFDYINHYDGPRGNSVYYLAGDATDMATYERLGSTIVAVDGPMNLVFSDGFHEGAALVAEVEGLLSHGAISGRAGDEFAMLWDDCNGDLRAAVFESISPCLRSRFPGRFLCVGMFVMPGWLGDEYHHTTCVFTTMDMSGPHLGASREWMATWADVGCG